MKEDTARVNFDDSENNCNIKICNNVCEMSKGVIYLKYSY
jgi:hypothetical protein